MVKAHSLLYAVYICLIVSLLCGALLYFASLYNQLNQFYNIREDLYIQNQSAVNFALGGGFSGNFSEQDSLSGVVSTFEMKHHGLLDLLVVQSSAGKDTIASVHFVGRAGKTNDGIYLSNFSKGLNFGGEVKLIGDKKLPTATIRQEFLNSITGKLTAAGKIELSDMLLPAINSRFEEVVQKKHSRLTSLKDLEKAHDSIYYNSFLNEPIEIVLSSPVLDKVIIRGNFILYAKDSVSIGKKAVLEDVIIKAPKIYFEEGFKGNIQAFSTKEIKVGKEVELQYPSILCLHNASIEKASLEVEEGTRIYGAIVLFGSKMTKMEDNEIVLKEKTLLVGDIYCTGKLMIGGKVYGSVYTNRFFHRTDFGNYDNCIINAEIDCSKKPSYFVSVPLFDTNASYGLQKKVY